MRKIYIETDKVKEVIEDLLDFYEISITKYRMYDDINNLENIIAKNDLSMFSSIMSNLGFYIKEIFDENEEIKKVQVYFYEELISEREYK